MKLQPNFSWQKYEGKPESQKEQFQFQLQKQHILVANAINTTIDDLSFWTNERQTVFTWINGQRIYTKSLLVTWAGGGLTATMATGIVGNFVIVDIVCAISDGTLSTSNTLSLPHIDLTVAANEVSIERIGTNIVINAGVDRSAYTGYVTIYYYKT